MASILHRAAGERRQHSRGGAAAVTGARRNVSERHAVMRGMHPSRILVLVLLLAACGTNGGVPLDGRTFVSSSVVEDGEERPLVAGTEIRLTFTDGQLSAQAGCNIFGASYRVEDGTLVADGGSMTEMGCDEDRSAQDEWFFSLLGARPRIELTDDGLVLETGDTVITFLDREVAEPDLALVGPTWTVESIIVGDAVASVPAGAIATLTFADDGTLSAETGCNSGGGRYEIDGDELRLSDLVQTDIGCIGAAAELESAVVAVLTAGSVRYSIDADALTLMAGDRGLILRGS
jgi:heat shock protein HslJ